MRNITVDLSNRPPLIDDKYGGELGEHQATTLNIIPEKNMTEDEDIAFYYVLFAVEGGLVASRTFSRGENISIALWGQLLEQRQLAFQLIGTNGLETIISKSPVLTLFLGDSLTGTVIGIDDNRDSLIAMIGGFNERLEEVEGDVSSLDSEVIKAIKKADGTVLPVTDNSVTLPDYASKTDIAVTDITELTGNEIRTAWAAGKALCYSDAGNRYKASVISVMEDTIDQVAGVTCEIISYISTDVFINQIFVPNTSTTKTISNNKRRVGIHPDEKRKLSGGSIASKNGSFVTGGQVYSEGYLKSIPTASTSVLGGVKVDGTSITIDANGVISSSGGSGASAMIVTFTTENDDIVSDYTIHEIVTAHNSGSVVLGKMMNEGAGIEFVFNLSAALEVEGIALAEFTSMFDSGDDAIVVSILGTNEGESDGWHGLYRAIPEEITTTTSVSQYSTDDEVPTAKAVYDAIKPDFVVTAKGFDFIKVEMSGGLDVTLTTNKTLTELLAKAVNHEQFNIQGGIYVEEPDPDYAGEGVFDVQKYELWYYRYGTADYINYLLEECGSEDTTSRPGIALVFQHIFPRGSNKNVSFDRYAAWAIIVYESESSPGTISYEYTDDLSNLL